MQHALLALSEAGAIATPSGKAYPCLSDLEAGLAKGIVPSQVPWLLGRAGIDLTFQKKLGSSTVTVSVVLDGFAAPLSSGSVLDLVQRAFYNGLSVNSNVQVESEQGPRRDRAATVKGLSQILSICAALLANHDLITTDTALVCCVHVSYLQVLLGAQPSADTLPRLLQPPKSDKGGGLSTASQKDEKAATMFSSGFIEPTTGKQRRLPLEVLRTRKSGKHDANNLVYSAARNSAVSGGTWMVLLVCHH